MKTFVVQSLALIGTVLVFVEATSTPASHPNKMDLLTLIINDAKNMSETWSEDLLKDMVENPKMGAIACPRCFFWRAEMSLKKRYKDLPLHRHLHQYNKLANNTHCALDKNKKCTLQVFLKNIIECANNLL